VDCPSFGTLQMDKMVGHSIYKADFEMICTGIAFADKRRDVSAQNKRAAAQSRRHCSRNFGLVLISF
jgi:hypothetical protein